MATQVQNRRGTTAEHSTFTGANGEVTVDTTKKTVVVHDGTTVGGAPLLRENGSQNAVTTGTSTAASFLPSSSTVPTNGVYLPAANTVGISTNSAGRITVDSSGNLTINGQGDLRLADSDSSNYVAIQAPSSVTANVTWTLPSSDGASGQFLKTDGSGTLGWQTPSSSVSLGLVIALS